MSFSCSGCNSLSLSLPPKNPPALADSAAASRSSCGWTPSSLFTGHYQSPPRKKANKRKSPSEQLFVTVTRWTLIPLFQLPFSGGLRGSSKEGAKLLTLLQDPHALGLLTGVSANQLAPASSYRWCKLQLDFTSCAMCRMLLCILGWGWNSPGCVQN